MTLNQLKTKANTKLAALWDKLVIREEAYRLKHDNYFQLIATNPVVDGVDSPFELRHPSDETNAPDIQLTFDAPIPFLVQVDTWGNDSEQGYRMTAQVELPDGRQFKRSRSLTDTRVLTQDYDRTDEFNPVPVGDPYLVGDTPVIETSQWEEVVQDETT